MFIGRNFITYSSQGKYFERTERQYRSDFDRWLDPYDLNQSRPFIKGDELAVVIDLSSDNSKSNARFIVNPSDSLDPSSEEMIVYQARDLNFTRDNISDFYSFMDKMITRLGREKIHLTLIHADPSSIETAMRQRINLPKSQIEFIDATRKNTGDGFSEESAELSLLDIYVNRARAMMHKKNAENFLQDPEYKQFFTLKEEAMQSGDYDYERRAYPNGIIRNKVFLHFNPSVMKDTKAIAWKIHLAARDLKDYLQLLPIVLPFLKEQNAKHKFMASMTSIEQSGLEKGITVYSKDLEQFKSFAKALDDLITRNNLTTQGLSVKKDNAYGQSGRVFYRNDRDSEGNYVAAKDAETYMGVANNDPFKS